MNLAEWQEFSDPRCGSVSGATCRATMAKRAWRHWAEKRLCDTGELWEETFSADALLALPSLGREGRNPQSAEWELAAERLRRELDESLERPPALCYVHLDRSKSLPDHERWLLVLSCGATLAARTIDHGGNVLTCLLHRQFSRMLTIYNRWRNLFFRCRNKYAMRDPESGRLLPPQTRHTVSTPRRRPNEDRKRIRFVTEQSWRLPGPQRLPAAGLPAWFSQPLRRPAARERRPWMALRCPYLEESTDE